MKASRILGITFLVSSLTTCGTWVYNEHRHEKENQLLWDKYMVEKYDSAKYNQLKEAKIRDYDIWAKEADRIQDSLNTVRRQERDPRNLLKDTCDTLVKGLKKIKK